LKSRSLSLFFWDTSGLRAPSVAFSSTANLSIASYSRNAEDGETVFEIHACEVAPNFGSSAKVRCISAAFTASAR